MRRELAAPAATAPFPLVPQRLLNAGPVMTPGGRLWRPCGMRHFGRMSQTSIERLRDYLAQLPPQAQALLMREFERAIERGEDTAVANFVLEQLRKIVRGTGRGGAAAHRRSGAADVPPAGAVPGRRQFAGPAGPDPARVAAADLAMAGPRRRPRRRAEFEAALARSRKPAPHPISTGRCANSRSPPPTPSSRSRRRCPAATSSARWPASARPT